MWIARMGRIVAALSFAVGLACNATGTGTTDAAPALGGSIKGSSFVVADAVVATTVAWKSRLWPGDSTVVLFSTVDHLCERIQAGTATNREQILLLDLAETSNGTASPIAGPGTFVDAGDLNQPRVFSANYDVATMGSGPRCDLEKASLTSGTVTISAIDAGKSMTGMADLTSRSRRPAPPMTSTGT